MKDALSGLALREIARNTLFGLGFIWSIFPSAVCAQDDGPGGSPSYVVYNPNQVISLQGTAPYHHAYDLRITSPSDLPSGVDTVIALDGSVIGAPAGFTNAVASGFLTFAERTLTYSGPNQTQTVTVQLDIPNGTANGDFRYFIAAKGWPAGLNIANDGTYINMTVDPPFTFTSATVAISGPVDGSVFEHVLGQPALQVPVTIQGAAANNNPVDVLAASIAGVDATGAAIASSVLPLQPSGWGSMTASGSAMFEATTPGVYTITATAQDHLGGTASATSTFTVSEVVPPPTVVITSPPNASYDYYIGSAALQIPFIFEGRSLAGGIRSLSATIDGLPVAVSPTGINTLVATGKGTLSLAAGGEHVLEVTATDDHGTATASADFTINAIPMPSDVPLRGVVFFDLDRDGVRNGDDFGLPGVSVTLTSAAGMAATKATNAAGAYEFNISPGTYAVSVQRMPGFQLTTAKTGTVIVDHSAVIVPDTGFALSFCAMGAMSANGNSTGFWKTNVDKALAKRSNGAQVSAATLRAYTDTIASLALSPFDGLTLARASTILGSNGPAPTDLLAKQLLAAEYNYANGAYIGGSGTLTYAFVYFGEYVLGHPKNYSSAYLLNVKDWIDAYNNSHGGVIGGPGESSSGCGQGGDSDSKHHSDCERDDDTHHRDGGCGRDDDAKHGSDSRDGGDHDCDRKGH